MLVLLLCIEGVLLTVVSSSLNIINTDDVDQLHPTMLEKYGGISKANISERSIKNFRNFSSYFQGSYRACPTCGRINSKRGNFLIIRGNIVDPPYKYPWMIKLKLIKEWYAGGPTYYSSCGGAIINEYYVLTAAHCLENRNVRKFLDPKDVFVQFLTNTHQLTPGSAVERIIRHPEFDSYILKHDIALLKLKKQIICDMYKSPLCLPPPYMKIPNGAEIKIAGWGATETGRQSQRLREGVMKKVNMQKCSNFMTVQSLTGTSYCYVPFGQKMQSSAPGDSGSPSFYELDGYYCAVGVCAGGIKTHKVYTAVPEHLNWIKQVMMSSY